MNGIMLLMGSFWVISEWEVHESLQDEWEKFNKWSWTAVRILVDCNNVEKHAPQNLFGFYLYFRLFLSPKTQEKQFRVN